jgi:hypothetical protein
VNQKKLESCGLCRFWYQTPDEDGHDFGICRRFPPSYEGWAMSEGRIRCAALGNDGGLQPACVINFDESLEPSLDLVASGNWQRSGQLAQNLAHQPQFDWASWSSITGFEP